MVFTAFYRNSNIEVCRTSLRLKSAVGMAATGVGEGGVQCNVEF
jgi:hypothetical protein